MTQVIGNFIPLRLSLFSPGDTLASRIANEYQGAATSLALHSLIYLGADPAPDHADHECRRPANRPPLQRVAAELAMNATPAPISLTARGRSRRRLLVSRGAEAVAILAAVLAVCVLAIVVESVFERGYHALDLNLFTKGPATFGQTGGGIAPAFVGTILLIAVATLGAVPVGVLVAVYVSEFAPRRIGDQARLWLDVLNGIPAIVIGIFVFTLLVVGHRQSGYAGSFALGIIMLPLISRTTMEMLALVPNHLREASYALGVSKWRTVLGVVLPGAAGGILTGTILAVARAAGETAPLLFVSSITANIVTWNPHNPLASIPITIFEYSEQPDPLLQEQAWAAAFVLIMGILVLSLGARLLHDRSRKRLGQIQ